MAVYRDFVPDFDATVVARLRQAGAVMLGKLHLHEGAYGEHHPDTKKPLNPWNLDYWPGGSSSGSGVATAAGLCFASLGSDTGGSIRFPCHANAVTGVKPTWGRVSRHGVFPLAESLDTVGPMARSAADAAAVLGAIAGHDPEDPTSLRIPVPDYLAGCRDIFAARGLRIGFDKFYASEGTDPQIVKLIADTLGCFRELGAEIRPIGMPDIGGRQTEELHDGYCRACLGSSQAGGRRDPKRALSRAAARHSDRREGSLLHQGHADDSRDDHPQGLPANL